MRALLALCVGAALAAAAPEVPAVDPAPPAPALAGLELPPLEQLQNQALDYVAAQAAGQSGTYTFRVVKPPSLPRLATPGGLTFEPDHLSRKDFGGTFFVTFRIVQNGRPAGMVRVDLEGQWNGILLRSRSALTRKVVPEAAQFEQVDFTGAPPAGALDEIPAGYRLRSPLGPGHILVLQDLEPIPLVVAGDPVRVEMVSGPLTIAVEALARSNGAMGEKIRVEMPSSHKNIQAVVNGPGEARVQWAGGN